jgi:hypothetical protein
MMPGLGGSGLSAGGAGVGGSDVVVSLSDLKQWTSGFGASTAWGSPMSTSDGGYPSIAEAGKEF